jgi:hypothetical protein
VSISPFEQVPLSELLAEMSPSTTEPYFCNQLTLNIL